MPSEEKKKKKSSKALIISDVRSAKKGKVPPLFLHFKHAKSNVDEIVNAKPEVEAELVEWKGDKAELDLKFQVNEMKYKNSGDKQDSYYTTYLAIRDKASGKTRLIEAQNMLMKPDVEVPKSTNPVLLRHEPETASAETRLEANKSLIKAFGQKKGQRYYENKELLSVDDDETAAKVLRAAGAVDSSKLNEKAETTSKLDIVPPRDETAGRADMIYRMEHILTEREVKDLIEACRGALEEFNSVEALEEGVKSRIFSPIGVHFLKKLLNQEELDSKAALALYMDATVKFTRLRPADLAKGNHALPKHIPAVIKKKLFDSFSSGSATNKIITPVLKDKAICYTIVMALMLNKFSFDVSLLTESVRVDNKNLKKLVMLTGANLETDPSIGTQKIILRKTLATYDVNYSAKKRKN